MKITLFKKTYYLFWVSKSEFDKVVASKFEDDLKEAIIKSLKESITKI